LSWLLGQHEPKASVRKIVEIAVFIQLAQGVTALSALVSLVDALDRGTGRLEDPWFVLPVVLGILV